MPLSQADSSITRADGGTWLGLFILWRPGALMQDTITLDSTPGRGRIFRVESPQPAAPNEDTVARLTAGQAVAACGGHHSDLLRMDTCRRRSSTSRRRRAALAPGDVRWQRVPTAVAITASALEEDRARCRDAGMDDFISKPFQAGELVATLARHLSYRRAPEAG